MTTSIPPPPLSPNAALFLDFDGTLVPFAPRPQDVRVDDGLIDLLGGLSASLSGALAIVSGRPLDDLDRLLAPLRLPTAGLHGAESRSADGRVERQEGAPPAVFRDAAEALVAAHAGLLLEDKRAGLALHYRARPELEALCRDTLQRALHAAGDDALDRWHLMPGHAVIELKQRHISKGAAVDAFMREAPFEGREAVYVGDDVTDEDGIAAAQAAGGWGVRVGPGESAARHRLADVAAVAQWLRSSAAQLGRRAPT